MGQPSDYCGFNQSYLEGLLSHFTTFAIMAVLPAKFTCSLKDISPQEIVTGETVNITASISNTGGREGICPVDLLINGTKESSRNVTVPANVSQTVVFELIRTAVGGYSITINKSSGSFIVESSTIATTTAPASPTSSEETEGKPLNWTLIGIIAVIAVVVLLFIILLIRKKRLY